MILIDPYRFTKSTDGGGGESGVAQYVVNAPLSGPLVFSSNWSGYGFSALETVEAVGIEVLAALTRSFAWVLYDRTLKEVVRSHDVDGRIDNSPDVWSSMAFREAVLLEAGHSYSVAAQATNWNRYRTNVGDFEMDPRFDFLGAVSHASAYDAAPSGAYIIGLPRLIVNEEKEYS